MSHERCPVCGWFDDQPLKWPAIKPHERLQLHIWAKHGGKFPKFTKVEK